MRILPIDRSTVLVELAGLDEVLALQASLTAVPIDGIHELLPAARTLMLRFDPERLTRERLEGALAEAGADALANTRARCETVAPTRTSGPLVEIPVRYDGEDLAEVARLAGLTVEEVIRRHQASEFTVAFCGFAPGFAYLVGGDPALQVPRRATPRPQVPAGAVALGGGYCGVYPQATPGGWQLIGRTSMAMWDPDRDPPARLTPGMRVRFRAIGAGEPEAASAPEAVSAPGAAEPPHERRGAIHGAPPAGPRIEVTAAMLPVLVQDLGRPGHAHLGVAPSGAADRAALQAANRAVGNPPGLACLEITLGSAAFHCRGDTRDAIVVAVAGAAVPLTVQRASGQTVEGETVVGEMEQAITLGPGDGVKLGYPARGLRSYLAVRGGIEAPRLLGSASRDTLAALGPAPITKGAMLAVACAQVSGADPDLGGDAAATVGGGPDRSRSAVPPLPASGDTVVLDVVAGPRADLFTDAALATLCDQVWQVTPQSSRVGLRLRGLQPLMRRDATELPSEGVVCGAIQVPHDGQPVLLLADHPLTGGYPVIAVVAEHHRDLAGQIPPGAKVRFRAT
jgi:KipI family sensor histidine kinase inhibitor